MFDFMCYRPLDSYVPKHEDPPPPSYVRLFHTASGCRAVDIYFNDHMVAKKFGYKKYTPYFAIPEGEHTLYVYKAGAKDKPLSTLDIKLKQYLIYTIVVEGSSGNRLLLVNDPKIECQKDMANIRFIHVSPDIPPLNIVTSENNILFEHLSYRYIPDYTSIEPGKQTFHLRQCQDSKPLVTVPQAELKGEWNYTIYIIGSEAQKSGIHAMTLIDGSTYIK